MNSLQSVAAILFICFTVTCAVPILDHVDRVLQNLLAKETQLQSLERSDVTFKRFHVEEFLDHGNQFKNFITEYEKTYDTDSEIEKRFGIFRENLKQIDRLRAQERGTAEYGVTHFADLTASEFNFGLSPLNWDELENHVQSFEPYNASFNSNFRTLKRINFKEQGKVLDKVQDQQMCGSCWAHSATANLESAYAIKHNQLVELSKQQLVDCDFADDGCCGGWPFNAFDYIKYVGGIMTEVDYRQRVYEGPCKFDRSKVKANVDKRYIIFSRDEPVMNEDKFERFMNDVGPLTAVINAEGFRFYKGGIMNQPELICDKSPYSLNHAVFNIGYDTEVINGETYSYWIIKNSWGRKWGEQGYLRIAKGVNSCGLGWLAIGVAAV